MTSLQPNRDLRIDFFRGVALYIILVDHISDNPVARLTYQRFGFSDAAEAFVFLSGISCGLAYSKLLARGGWGALAVALISKGTRLYLHYIATSIATIALLWSTRSSHPAPDAANWQFWTLARESPHSAIWNSVLLLEQPSLPSILVLYMALTLAALPLVLAGARRHMTLTTVLSGAVWLIPQTGLMGLDQPTRMFPYFNPLAWQFLFCIGVICGSRHGVRSHDVRDDRTVRSSVLLVAWGIAVASLAWRFYPTAATRLDLPLAWYRSFGTLGADKYNLSCLRLAHFASIAVLVATHVAPTASLLHFGHDCLIKAGKLSLAAFSFGTILSLLGSILFLSYSLSFPTRIAYNVLAISCMALLIEMFGSIPRPAIGITAETDR